MIDLHRLTTALGVPPDPADHGILITSLAYDSRRVQPGSLFVAIPGFHVDGHAFLPQAVGAGAAALVIRRDQAERLAGLPPVRVFAVDDTRRALSVLAAAWHDQPGERLRVVGVTGTDGKTTTTYLTSALLEAAGHVTGLMGTVQFKVAGAWRENDTRQTTPEAPEVQALLAEMADAGVGYAIVESSSHGLELRKLDHCAYDIAVVTNVGEDHLELHGTPAAYLAAKGRLFALLDAPRQKPGLRWGIVNADDPSAAHMRARTGADVLSYGIDQPADVRAEAVQLDAGGADFRLLSPWGTAAVRTQLPGRFNVSNVLAAATVALAEGVPVERIAGALAGIAGVPGRLERIDAGQPFTVIVDYAHTGPAFAKVLSTLRPLTAGRIIAVFGCAGGRSPERREGMGRAAAAHADFAVLADEDPYEEDRDEIIADIAIAMQEAGAVEGEQFVRIPDRREAVHAAFARARPGDLVLLAGKGHEQSIIIGRTKTPWDDRRVAREELAALGYGAGQPTSGG